VDLTKKQQEEAKKRIEELQEEPADEEDDGAQRTLAIKEVEEQSLLLKADLDSSKVVSSQVRSRLPVQDFGNTGIVTFGDRNSGFQAGNVSGGVSGISFGGK
jgi:seryl-tRNA synthetase